MYIKNIPVGTKVLVISQPECTPCTTTCVGKTGIIDKSGDNLVVKFDFGFCIHSDEHVKIVIDKELI